MTEDEAKDHVWPEVDDLLKIEHEFGCVYCRRCGYLLVPRKTPMKPCRSVKISLR